MNERQGKMFQSVPVPDKSSMISYSTGDTFSLSQNSQFDKTKTKTRYAWMWNKNIGRRTGKDVTAGKNIRVGKNGMEIFDDYLDESEAESFLSVSSSSRRKSTKTDFSSEQQDTTCHSKQTGQAETGCSNSDLTNDQENTAINGFGQRILTERTDNRYLTDSNKSEYVENVSERAVNEKTKPQNSKKHVSSNKENSASRSLEITSDKSDTRLHRRSGLNKEIEVTEGQDGRLSQDEDQDREQSEDGGQDGEKSDDEGQDWKISEDEAQDEDQLEDEAQEGKLSEDEDGDGEELEDEGQEEAEYENQVSESERSEDDKSEHNHIAPDGVHEDGSNVGGEISDDDDRDSDNKEESGHFETEEPMNFTDDGDNDINHNDIEGNEEVDSDQSDQAENGTEVELLENNRSRHPESRVSSEKSSKHTSSGKSKEKLVRNETDNKDSHPNGEVDYLDEPILPPKSNRKTGLNDGKSERNKEMLHVTGNNSGSITKKTELSGSGSDIAFNRSKKRLSYSALIESEEKAKARAEKVEAANRQFLENKQNNSKQNDVTRKTENKQSQKNLNQQKINQPRVQSEELDNDNNFLCLSSRSVHKTVRDNPQRSDGESTDISIIDDIKTNKHKSNLGLHQNRNSIQKVGKLKGTDSSLKTKKSKSVRKSLDKGNKGKLVEKRSKTVSKNTKNLDKKKESTKKVSKVNRKLVDELEYLEAASNPESVSQESDIHDDERAYTDEKFQFLSDSDKNTKSTAKDSVTKNRKRTSPTGTVEDAEASPPKQRKQSKNNVKDTFPFNFVAGKNIKTSKSNTSNKNRSTEESPDGANRVDENKKKRKTKRQSNKRDVNRKSSTEESVDEDEKVNYKNNYKKSLLKQANKANNHRKSSSEDNGVEDEISISNKKKESQKQSNNENRQRKSSTEESGDGGDRTVGNNKKATQKQSIKAARKRGSNESGSSADVSPLMSRTPEPDSRQVSTNFQSGVSMRVSRRSELLDDITSGPKNRGSAVNVEMEPSKELTPCITKNGQSRKSKGRRVTICPEENTHHLLSADESEFRRPLISKQKKGGTHLPGDETSLRGVDSTPVHIFECTQTEVPLSISKLPKGYSELPVEDRLIYPEPAPDGLRRSKRVRLKPVATYKNEEIIRRYEPGVGEVIVGVKPSMETVYIKKEEIKRKKRQFKGALKRATKGNQKKPKRKLSIHVDLPRDMVPHESEFITIVNPYTGEKDGIDCMAFLEDLSKIGPSGNPHTTTDPYSITIYFDQPCMSSGMIELEPQATKPTSIVGEQAVFEQFIIHEGKVLVKIENASSLMETGDTFFVPSGNTYSITNMRNDPAKLFYHVQKMVK